MCVTLEIAHAVDAPPQISSIEVVLHIMQGLIHLNMCNNAEYIILLHVVRMTPTPLTQPRTEYSDA